MATESLSFVEQRMRYDYELCVESAKKLHNKGMIEHRIARKRRINLDPQAYFSVRDEFLVRARSWKHYIAGDPLPEGIRSPGCIVHICIDKGVYGNAGEKLQWAYMCSAVNALHNLGRISLYEKVNTQNAITIEMNRQYPDSLASALHQRIERHLLSDEHGGWSFKRPPNNAEIEEQKQRFWREFVSNWS